ncbi:MAG: nucleotidyltransferase family protein [Planctomycetota bacterium]
MTDISVHRWLIGLCDPAGCAQLASQRLDPSQIQQLFQLADEHGVTGAVLTNLHKLLEAEGPSRITGLGANLAIEIEAAHQRWFATVAMTLCLRERTTELIAALRRERLPVAVIKGEDFTDRLYDQPSLRPFRDIDLMMPREVIDSTAHIMSGLGYRFVLPGGNYNENYGERTWDSCGEPRARVELHWNLINCPSQRRRSSLAFDELQWEETTAAGQTTLRATPAAMLLIASVHAVVSHRFDRLQHLCDIRQICRGRAGELDYDWLKEAARRNGNVAALGGALEVAGRLLKEPACHAVLEQLQLPVATTVWRCLVSNDTLLQPYTRLNKLRRTAMREWMKRAA